MASASPRSSACSSAFCLMPITGFIGFILGVIALIFGLAGWGRVRKNKATTGKTAITGAILGALAIAGGIAGIVMFFTAVENFGNDMDKIGDDWTSYSDCMGGTGSGLPGRRRHLRRDGGLQIAIRN